MSYISMPGFLETLKSLNFKYPLLCRNKLFTQRFSTTNSERSERKSTIDKSDRLRKLEVQRQTAKFKKKKAEIQPIEVETSLTENKVDPVEGGIDTNPSVE